MSREAKFRKNKLQIKEEPERKKIETKNRKSSSKVKESPKRERSREKSLIKEKPKIEAITQETIINIPTFDDSKSEEPITIENYINNKKKELKSNKISLIDYIKKVDVDNEQIFKCLENMFKTNIKRFLLLI